MAGLDPRLVPLVDRANAALGYSYRVPVNTAQPLTPEEQAIGAAQAQEAAAVDAAVAANPAHAAPPEQTATQPLASIPLDWTPQAQPQATAIAAPQELQPSPEQVPAPRPGVMGAGSPAGGGGATGRVLSGMVADAGQRRQEGEKLRDSAAIEGDIAREDLKLSAEQLGESRANVADAVSGYRQDLAKFEAQQREELFSAYDAQQKALAVKESEQKELAQFMQENREPRDRRSWGQKIVGALAVALSGIGDQANLAAGLNMGMNIQTNNADRAMAMIDRAIQRDLESQREMLANARTEYAAKNTEMGQIRERYGDRVDAYKLAAATKYGQAQNEIEAAMQRGMSDEAKIVAQQTIAEIDLKRNAILEELGNTAAEKALAQEQQLKLTQAQRTDAAAAARARAQQPLSTKEALELEGKALDNAEKRQKLLGGPAGSAGAYGMRTLPGAQPTEDLTKEAVRLASSAEGVRATLAQLRGMAEKGATLSPTERNIARRRLASLKSQFNGVFGDGTAPNEAQLKELDNMFSNPAEFNMADSARQFEAFDRDAVEMINAKLRPFGYALDGVDVRPE